MKGQNHRSERSKGALMLYVFGIFMLFFYLGMSYMFLFSEVLAENLSPVIRYGMGGLFLVYGIFRLYRQVRTSRQNDDE